MTVHLTGILVATLSAASADLDTTRQFTADGYRELNPFARPFVAGRGSDGEALLEVFSVSAYVLMSRAAPEPFLTSGLLGAWVIHAWMVQRNVTQTSAKEVTRIVTPFVVIMW